MFKREACWLTEQAASVQIILLCALSRLEPNHTVHFNTSCRLENQVCQGMPDLQLGESLG